MRRYSILPTVAFALLGIAGTCAAQEQADLIARGKRATALVEIKSKEGRAFGSAFCIDKAGLFVTNSHVVEAADEGGTVRLILYAGAKEQRVARAKVLRNDGALDLALLKVEANDALTALELGKDDKLVETAEVNVFGYPFGKALATRRDGYPNVSINTSRITSLKEEKGKLKFIQLDGALNPGNSGGPVVDKSGKVIGVVVAGILGAGINFAIPVGQLTAYLETPTIVCQPGPLRYADRGKPVTWTIRVEAAAAAKLPPGLAVAVILPDGEGDGEGEGETRRVSAKAAEDGSYKATFTPLPKDPGRQVELTVTLKGVVYRGLVDDREVKVDGKAILLSELRELASGPPPRARTNAGQALFGPITGLGRVKLQRGEKTFPVDLDKATNIAVRARGEKGAVTAIVATIEVKEGPKVLATIRKRVALKGAPEDLEPVAADRPGVARVALAQGPANGDDLLDIEGLLDVKEGAARGSAREIRPPKVAIGSARLGAGGGVDAEIRKFAGHTNGIWCVAISPDGHRVLTASHDTTVRLWDAESGHELKCLRSHTDHVKAVAFLPDGVRALSAGDDDAIILWDLETGRPIRRLVGHTADVQRLAVSADGKRALSGASDQTMRLWDVEAGREQRRFEVPGVVGVSFLPDGRRALSASANGSARLWDLETGRELRRVDVPGVNLHGLAISPDGRRALLACSDGVVRIWDLENGRDIKLLTRHDDVVAAVAFTHDGRRALSVGTGKDGALRIWDLDAGREARGHRGPVALNSVAVAPDDRSVVVGGTDGIARLWRLPDPAAPIEDSDEPLVRKLPGTIGDVAVGGGGRYLLLTLRDLKKLAVFDANTGAVTKYLPLPSADALVAAGAEKAFVVFPEQKLIQRWDLATLEKETTGPSPINGKVLAISMGGDSAGPILAAWSAEGANNQFAVPRFSFIDPETLKVLKIKTVINSGMNQAQDQQPGGGSLLLNIFALQNARYQIRAAANGRLFGLWRLDVGPAGCQTIAIAGKTVRAYYDHSDAGFLAPGPEGKALYTGTKGAIAPDTKPIGTPIPNGQPTEALIPSPDPAYHLGIKGINIVNFQPNPGGPVTANVHFGGVAAAGSLFTVGELDELKDMGKDQTWSREGMSLDKRIFLIPAANLLVTIPPTNDRLVLRKLDIAESLEKQGGDFLFVTSPTALKANTGETFRHKVAVKSKKGGITYVLTSGPDEMKVSPEGELTWKVPEDEEDEEVIVVLTIGDSTGQEVFHTLKLRVR